MAVISEVILRTADSVAAKPCPPPKEITRGLIPELIPVQHLDVKRVH